MHYYHVFRQFVKMSDFLAYFQQFLWIKLGIFVCDNSESLV